MTEHVDMECPNCGRTIRSSVVTCPHCKAHLEFHDMEDLERVANGLDIDEKSRVKEKETDLDEDADKKGFIGKLFARGRK